MGIVARRTPIVRMQAPAADQISWRIGFTAATTVRPRVADEHLFISRRGAGLSTQAVHEFVTKYARRAGLEDVSPHMLRHSFAKHTLDAGESLVAVAALLAHEKPKTTAIYAQPSERDLACAVAQLEREGAMDR